MSNGFNVRFKLLRPSMRLMPKSMRLMPRFLGVLQPWFRTLTGSEWHSKKPRAKLYILFCYRRGAGEEGLRKQYALSAGSG